MAKSIEETQVPQAVREAFAKKFPGAEAKEWEIEAEYEVEFEKDGKEIEVSFYPNGTIAQIEYSIDPNELPDAVKAAVKINHPNCEIEEAERVEKGDGTILYEVSLSFELHINPEGKIAAMGKDL